MNRYKQELKLRVFFRERGCCFYCERALNLKNSTLDHVIPRSRGGKLHYDNVVLACSPCNNERGNMSATKFLLRKRKSPAQRACCNRA